MVKCGACETHCSPPALAWFEGFAADPAPPGDLLLLEQRAGDLVYTPAGWWHSVLNLEESMALTRHFCAQADLID